MQKLIKNHPKKTVLIAVTFLGLLYILNAALNKPLAPKEEFLIKELVLSNMRKFNIPSAGIAILENNKIVQLVEIESHLPKKDILFQAASISKAIASVLMLRIYDKKIIDLDIDINRFLVNWKVPYSSSLNSSFVTLRQIASMTSGLSISGFGGYTREAILPNSLQILKGEPPCSSPPVELISIPGEKYEYSGGGYQTLEVLLENVTNRSFESLLKSEIFEPLQMVNSRVTNRPLTEDDILRAAFATDSLGKQHSFEYKLHPELASAGIWSTAKEMGLFLAALMNDYQGVSEKRFLSTSAVYQLFSRQKNTPYGLGFVIDENSSQLRASKLGQNMGYQSWIVAFPKLGSGAVILTNSDNGRLFAEECLRAFGSKFKWPDLGPLRDGIMLNEWNK